MFSRTLKQSIIATLIFLAATSLFAQKADKPLPPVSLNHGPFLVLDSVVTEQWPAIAGAAVNPPAELKLLNPGQCIRVGVIAVGSGHEHFFDGLSIAYTANLAGHRDNFITQPAGASRLMKPEGGDFVTGALAAAGIKNPMETVGVLAVSADKWCVPIGATDGAANFHVEITLHGKSTTLSDTSIPIESVESAAKKKFASLEQFGDWSMVYHRQPEPGRLLAAIQFIAGHRETSPIMPEFLKAALAQDAATTRTFGPEIGKMDKNSQILALFLLSEAKVTLDHPPARANKDEEYIDKASSLPDPYDWNPGGEIWNDLDLLWADFSATGRKEPIAAITHALAWKLDYDAFVAMQKRGEKPTELNESIIHAVTYMAAGWSLSSFNSNDPLAADYINAIHADSKTSPEIRAALETLYTNPAFKQHQ